MSRVYLVVGQVQHIVRSDLGPPWSTWCNKDFHVFRETLRPERDPDVKLCIGCQSSVRNYSTRTAPR